MLRQAGMVRCTIILSAVLLVAVLSAGCTQTEETLPPTPTSGSSLEKSVEAPTASPTSEDKNPENTGFSFAVVEYPTDEPDVIDDASDTVSESQPATEVPTVAPKPSSTPANSQGIGSFSMATANTRRPVDILETVSLFMGGGGGGSCTDLLPLPHFAWPASKVEIVPISKSEIGPQGIPFLACGLTDKETVPVSIVLPDGTTKVDMADNKLVEGIFAAYYDVDLGSEPEVGSYNITMGEEQHSLGQAFTVAWPKGPRLYRLADESLVLWNFQPEEKIRLYAYEEFLVDDWIRKGRFAGYQDYWVSPVGELYITMSDSFPAYVVIGSKTGEVREIDYTRSIDEKSIQTE